jgi:hypothetical protein
MRQCIPHEDLFKKRFSGFQYPVAPGTGARRPGQFRLEGETQYHDHGLAYGH